MLAESFFSQAGLGGFGFRWLHILAGIMWIGLLYYFNFVQVPAFAAFGDEARARNIAIDRAPEPRPVSKTRTPGRMSPIMQMVARSFG